MKMGIIYIIAGTLLIIVVIILKLDKEKEEIIKPSETNTNTALGYTKEPLKFKPSGNAIVIGYDVKLVKATGYQSTYSNQSGSCNVVIGEQQVGAQAGN